MFEPNVKFDHWQIVLQNPTLMPRQVLLPWTRIIFT